MKNTNKNYELIFMKPRKFEDCAKCVNYIKEDKIIFVNLAGIDKENSQRILDYIAGAVYIKEGRMENPADGVLCIIPNTKDYLFDYDRENKNFGNYENETEEIIPEV